MGTNRINQLNNIGRVNTHSIKSLVLNDHSIDNEKLLHSAHVTSQHRWYR